jgi:ubiquinone biosynthesis protein
LPNLVEYEIPEVRRYRPVQVVGQLRGSLERELDLAVEARNTERFARNFADDLDILVPRVYWEWTSSVMNLQEHIEGIRGDDLAAIDNAGLDRKALAARGADAVLKMILVDSAALGVSTPIETTRIARRRLLMRDGHITEGIGAI